MKKTIRAIILILCIATLLIPEASALVPYTTYTYDIDGNYVDSPHAYVPDRLVTSADMGLETPLASPSDLETDSDGNVYIADPNNSRIVILNRDYTLNTTLKNFINDKGVPDNLDGAQGVFIRGDEVYVCDSKNARIVVFLKETEDGVITGITFDHIVEEPYHPVMKEGSVYTPVACAVDTAGRIYVVSSTTNEGIISMNANGGFLGFLGAQRTAPSAWQIFWRMFQTKEQRSSLLSQVPTEYNNIAIDESGFIFVTTSSLSASKAASAIASRSTSGAYAPVKKLNAQGEDVMMRTGFWPPSGEVTVVHYANVDVGGTHGTSLVTDVALGQYGIWSICDARRQRFYTYDSQGNLLFIFGDNGAQLGNNQNLGAICYQKDKFLSLDRTINAFTVYKRTAYGDDLFSAVQNVEERNYDQSAVHWKEVLLRNSNFDEAYIGIGDSLYRAGDYRGAQEYYSYAYDADGYSKCFAKIRKEWIEKYILVIPVVIIVLAFAISRFFKYANKVNEKGQVMKEKRTFWEAFLYGAHVIFHPFDGFWDLKHEKRGNFKAGAFFVALTILGYIYNDVGKSFWYDPYRAGISIVNETLGVLVPLALWVVGNWCLTTLFEGEGNFKDILLAACYSVIPLPLMMIPATILTHVLTLDESAVITLLIGIGYVWAGFLLVIGVMTTHDYSFGKNLLTVLGTLVAMVFIMFIVVLFSGLLSKIVSFFVNIFVELSLRV
ncbi:MAG: YIP1 family protein [Clostridia bacterium]|nr:YIP1 family protein [Clostridia bacterium]